MDARELQQLVECPPRDDADLGPVDLVQPVLQRIRHAPPRRAAVAERSRWLPLAMTLALALLLEWLAREPLVQRALGEAALPALRAHDAVEVLVAIGALLGVGWLLGGRGVEP